MIGATNDGAHFGQKRSQRPDCSRFSGSPVTESQDTADRRIHGCDQEGQFHIFLSDNRREGKRPPHMSEPQFGSVEECKHCFSTSNVSMEIVGVPTVQSVEHVGWIMSIQVVKRARRWANVRPVSHFIANTPRLSVHSRARVYDQQVGRQQEIEQAVERFSINDPKTCGIGLLLAEQPHVRRAAFPLFDEA